MASQGAIPWWALPVARAAAAFQAASDASSRPVSHTVSDSTSSATRRPALAGSSSTLYRSS